MLDYIIDNKLMGLSDLQEGDFDDVEYLTDTILNNMYNILNQCNIYHDNCKINNIVLDYIIDNNTLPISNELLKTLIVPENGYVHYVNNVIELIKNVFLNIKEVM